MEKNNKNVILIILALLVIFLGGYIVYDKVFSTDNILDNNIDSVVDNGSTNDDIADDNNSNNNEDIVSVGLGLYKLFTGNGSGPFKWEDGKVINYVDVITHMTQDYFNSSNKGFSIPYKDSETGEWKSFGGYGTDKESKFKNISIEKQEDNTVTFKITYEYTQMGAESTEPIEAFDTFVIRKVDGLWKVDKFQLIYDLKF